MTQFADIKARVRVLLEDGTATRFSEDLLGAALRLALDEINLRVPLVQTTPVTASGGRDLSLTGLEGCLYILGLAYPQDGGMMREMEPETNFTYSLGSGTPALHFSGSDYPAAGEVVNIRWVNGYQVEGFESATTGTLPIRLQSALINGSAAQACYLRAGMLLEAYGGRPGESARLIEIGRLWQNTFDRALSGVKTMQEFGFPPGFALDRWDRPGR